MNTKELKAWIKSEGGGVALAKKLDCKTSLVYSWTTKNGRTPKPWILSLIKEVLELRKENEVLKTLVKGESK